MREEIRQKGVDLMLAPLHEKVLGTFEVYSFIADVAPGDPMDCCAGVLLRLAREHGYEPIGIASERKNRGVYAVQLFGDRTRADTEVVYVGKHSYFSGHKSNVWSPKVKDYVYES